MATPTPPPATDPMMAPPMAPPPQWIPDPTGVYRKVVGAPSPFAILQQQDLAAGGGPVPNEMPAGPMGISTDAVTRRMQRNEDRTRRQDEQSPSPIASQSY